MPPAPLPLAVPTERDEGHFAFGDRMKIIGGEETSIEILVWRHPRIVLPQQIVRDRAGSDAEGLAVPCGVEAPAFAHGRNRRRKLRFGRKTSFGSAMRDIVLRRIGDLRIDIGVGLDVEVGIEIEIGRRLRDRGGVGLVGRALRRIRTILVHRVILLRAGEPPSEAAGSIVGGRGPLPRRRSSPRDLPVARQAFVTPAHLPPPGPTGPGHRCFRRRRTTSSTSIVQVFW